MPIISGRPRVVCFHPLWRRFRRRRLDEEFRPGQFCSTLRRRRCFHAMWCARFLCWAEPDTREAQGGAWRFGVTRWSAWRVPYEWSVMPTYTNRRLDEDASVAEVGDARLEPRGTNMIFSLNGLTSRGVRTVSRRTYQACTTEVSFGDRPMRSDPSIHPQLASSQCSVRCRSALVSGVHNKTPNLPSNPTDAVFPRCQNGLLEKSLFIGLA